MTVREEQLFLGGAGHCLEVFRKEMVQTNQAAPENLAAVLLAKHFFPAIQAGCVSRKQDQNESFGIMSPVGELLYSRDLILR